MNGEVSASMRSKGINYKLNFGLNSISIREVAASFSPDKELAEELWKDPVRECKILATMLYPKEEFTKDSADKWLDDCFTTELTEQLCFNLLQYLDFAPEKALQWIKDEDESRRSAGYNLFLRLKLCRRRLPKPDGIMESAEKDTNSDNYTLKSNAEKVIDALSFA